jgi:ferredoxin-NADP reductase
MPEIVAVLREARPESVDAVTLRFEPRSAFPYRPGQHLKVDPHQFAVLDAEVRRREAQRGKPLGPGYFSIASDGLDPRLLELTVKLAPGAPPPLVAGHLARGLRVGDEVRVDGPGGSFGLPESAPEGIGGFVHLCAGGGAAPHRGMIRHALGRNWPQKHLLLVQDRGAADALYREEWAALAEKHPERFRVRAVLSRERGERIDADRVRREAEGFLDLGAAWGFLCGPNQPRPDGPGFVDRCRALLLGLGFAADRVRSE